VVEYREETKFETNIEQTIDTPVKIDTNPIQQFIIMLNRIDRPFLFAAVISLIVSVVLWFLVNRDYGVFVGLWVPSILILWVGIRVTLLSNALVRARKA